MSGLESFLWRSSAKWSDLVRIAETVIQRWNTVTQFVVTHDKREHIWTVRHSSVAQPFLNLNEDSLRGTAPRIGNPLPFLFLLGMNASQPGCIDITFANGQKIDTTKFELADLTSLLPHATHPAHRKLAELAITTPPPPPIEPSKPA